jgi:hypothetical protein
MKLLIAILISIIFTVLPAISQISSSQPNPQLTREVPDVRNIWVLNRQPMSDGDEKIGDRLAYIGEGRFFSIWIKVETVSGTPDYSVYVIGSYDREMTNLGIDLEGTYEIVENSNIADEWIFRYVSPSPCAGLTAKVVANPGSGDFRISVVFFKTR